jgi:hypothetical protein
MIRVFIGSHQRFERVEPVIKYSILKHASEPVEINFLRPEYYDCDDSGCTGFSKMRYEIPRICNYQGYAIYLDVDMILMDDIAKLWRQRMDDEWVRLDDGATEVMVIDCRRRTPKWFNNISSEWNREDWNCDSWFVDDAKLIHYTDLKSQPWFGGTKYPELAQLWFDLEKEALEKNTQ